MIFGFLARRGRKGSIYYCLLVVLWRGRGLRAWGWLAARRRAWCERPAFEGAERQHLSRACHVARRRVPEFLCVGSAGLRVVPKQGTLP